MPLVSTIQTESRALLNDAGNTLFTDAVLLPFTKKAYQELQDELTLNGIEDTIEETEVAIEVAALAKTVSLPADLIQPITLWERADGGADTDWVEMTEKAFIDPAWPLETNLKYWQWRENEIKLVGATTAREVRIRYVKFTLAISSESTNVPLVNCQTYLAARVAAIAALVIGGNPTRASLYQADAQAALNRIISTFVKRNQGQPTRRIPFRAKQ